MAAAAGERGIPLGHEGRGLAAARGDLLDPGLEERGLVRGGERLVVPDRRLVDARTGLRVQAFERHAVGGHPVEDRVDQLRLTGSAEDAVAEHAWRQGREAAEALLPERGRRLIEEEVLILH